ncbi:RIP metalloprotease RseP [Candidatus Falkowbacteria bacterium CG10_big_fil_rev_8_21_14_0_10_39_11]|uniref:Zinc metalloprotease n=1 Tax=Candidatus Falkowbacteria bacterium CG10_big_fil_rev_8_21_14_0_10_39_11 TaxID=1974565 RepID=A0A2H0V4K9_9BACT|nr:MAG: RIP metalloprotease RseP [Candidatus Falkowbacteria bacterium CG10_big_fil_rev_8_21_14_0_10_39_11]
MLLTIVVFVLMLGLLVFAHELGHYWTARKLGVKAEEFGFGLPPRMFGWKKVNGKRKIFWGNKDVDELKSEDTVWSINWLPLGGFVKIKGEDGENKENDSFAKQKPWKRIVILSAGVFMNFILSMVLLAIVFMLGAPQIVETERARETVVDPKIQILQVMPDSPAEAAGVKMGDVIVDINDQVFSTTEETSEYITTHRQDEIVLTVLRYGSEEQEDLTITPTVDTEGDQKIGVALIKSGIVKYPWYEAIWLGIKSTVLMTGAILIAFWTIIKNLFIGMPAGLEVSGPVGIAVMTGQAARMGLVYILQFTALLSINLAILNFLPFPALDGGRVLFVIIEKIRRKPMNQKIENVIHTIGFVFLIVLLLVVTGKDIFRSLF